MGKGMDDVIRTYCVPGTFNVFSYLISFYPQSSLERGIVSPFTDEESEAQRDKELPRAY